MSQTVLTEFVGSCLVHGREGITYHTLPAIGDHVKGMSFSGEVERRDFVSGKLVKIVVRTK